MKPQEFLDALAADFGKGALQITDEHAAHIAKTAGSCAEVARKWYSLLGRTRVRLYNLCQQLQTVIENYPKTNAEEGERQPECNHLLNSTRTLIEEMRQAGFDVNEPLHKTGD